MSSSSQRTARLLLPAAAGSLLLAELGLLLDIPVVGDWFYNFAWWSFIVLLNAVVHLRTGSSLLISRPRAFFLLLPWSCAFWLFFEAANFVLQNWYYVNSPSKIGVVAFGIFISFATVLPGVYGVAALLQSFGVGEKLRCRPLRLTPALLNACTVAGVASLALPLAFPRYAFPLIWGATLLLLEPWLARRGERGILTRLAAGDPGPPVRFLLTGLVCGMLWEFWNYWATSKWIYTVPFFEDGKIFEMPLLGFLGFPPFALECYTFGRALVAARLLPEWEHGVPDAARPPVPRGRPAAGVAVALLLSLPVGWGVSVWTIRSTPATVEDFSGMTPERAARLRQEGVRFAWQYLDRFREEPHALEALVPEAAIRKDWAREAELMGVMGLGSRGASWLASAGIESVEGLAAVNPDELLARLRASGEGPSPPPTAPEVRVWVHGAEDWRTDR